MCLRFVFLLVTRLAASLRLSRREEAWKTAEILILRHRLAILQRRQPRRPKLNWADRALLATLLSVIAKARRRRLRLLVTPRHDPGLAPRYRPAPLGYQAHAGAGLADPRPAGISRPWSSGSHARTPNGGTAGSTASWLGPRNLVYRGFSTSGRRHADLDQTVAKPQQTKIKEI